MKNNNNKKKVAEKISKTTIKLQRSNAYDEEHKTDFDINLFCLFHEPIWLLNKDKHFG